MNKCNAIVLTMCLAALATGCASTQSGSRASIAASAPAPDSGTPTADTTGDAAALCALCDKPIPAGGGVSATIDGVERRQYRCIHCALTHLQNEQRNIEITARSPMSGQSIRLRRHTGAWTAEPPTAVYLILPERADECLDLHQPFVSLEEFNRYVGQHPEIAAEHPQPFTIGQYEQMLRAGQPQ